MSRSIRLAAAVAAATALGLPVAAQERFPGVGRAATPAEIAAWDIDVRPDFKGLPPGSGSVSQGQGVWEALCESCHGTFAESNEVFAPLVGGTTAADIQSGRVKSLVTGDVARTTLMKVSTISTLWDYISRAMPWNAPKSLSVDQVYAVLAYILHLGDIVPGDFVLSDRTIAQVQARLPNRNGMTRDHGLWDVRGKPDVKNVACMRDCPVEARIASALPEEARGVHGNLREQNRPVGPARGTDTTDAPSDSARPADKAAAALPASATAEFARKSGCLTCHGIDKRIVGPSFAEVAAKYNADSNAAARLVEKIRKGGSGAWGAIPMPPHASLSDADVRSLVAWILAGAR